MDALACGFQDAVRIISLTSLPVSRSCDMCTVLESRPEIYHKQHLLDKEKKKKDNNNDDCYCNNDKQSVHKYKNKIGRKKYI